MLVALAVILLMAPAAFHRIAFGGEDSEDFHRIGSWFVIAATVPLAAGITGDVYVAIGKIAKAESAGIAAAVAALLVLVALWYVQPYWLRRKRAGEAKRSRN